MHLGINTYTHMTHDTQPMTTGIKFFSYLTLTLHKCNKLVIISIIHTTISKFRVSLPANMIFEDLAASLLAYKIISVEH